MKIISENLALNAGVGGSETKKKGRRMCFARKPWLGHYNGSKSDWESAYRSERINFRENRPLNPKLDGLRWKAALVVRERENIDPLMITPGCILMAEKIIDELLAESNQPKQERVKTESK